MKTILVGPSPRRAEWDAATFGEDDVMLEELVRTEPPGQRYFHLVGYVNSLYRLCQKWRAEPATVRPKVQRVLGPITALREPLGPIEQRELDLQLLGWIRRSSALSAVVGAGVSMDAGGPSWGRLVQQLLELARTRGREVLEMRPDPESTETHKMFSPHVVGVERFTPEQDAAAQAIQAAIRQGAADTETLTRGAQLCFELFGQHLFAPITEILYDRGRRTPGPIHCAIAELARLQHVPDRGPGLFPGWEAIISYNFDDLQGEAIDALGLARAAWAMRGSQLAGDPNEAARQAGRAGAYQPIYHIHGYTPRRFFFITHVQYVFAASQYLRFYKGNPQHIITKVLDEFLAHPIKYALYVGCSFQDDAMNDLLRKAAERLPGREHFALLKWPGPAAYATATPEEVARAARQYLDFGIRPVWFDDFNEVPELIRRLR